MNGTVLSSLFCLMLLTCVALLITIYPEVLNAGDCQSVTIDVNPLTGMEQVHMNSC